MNKTQEKRIILLADCQSFYASVEKAAHPEYKHQPVVVAGDPDRRSGIILAACPLAKKHGVRTAELLGESLRKCPDLIVIRPQMQKYIHVSLQITEIFQSYTDLVEPYSIDEQFLDVTGSIHLFGNEINLAKTIQTKVMNETGVYLRIGISENKILSKMACDNFAKHHPSGIFQLHKEEMHKKIWSLPINQMFMVGSRMKIHLQKMGIDTIGQLAQTPLTTLRAKWGINGEILWLIANGHDHAPVSPTTHQLQKSIGHQMTLPFDFYTLNAIKVSLLELADWVCQRLRAKKYMTHVLAVGCQGADFDDLSTHFYRQKKLITPTHFTNDIYQAAMQLFKQHWDGQPIRRIGITVSHLIRAQQYQLSFFHNREREQALEKTIDEIKEKYGDAAIIRASSLSIFGQVQDRAKKIGGHTK